MPFQYQEEVALLMGHVRQAFGSIRATQSYAEGDINAGWAVSVEHALHGRTDRVVVACRQPQVLAELILAAQQAGHGVAFDDAAPDTTILLTAN